MSEVGQRFPLVLIVGLRREDRLHLWPSVDDAIREGDILVALGAPDALVTLANGATES